MSCGSISRHFSRLSNIFHQVESQQTACEQVDPLQPSNLGRDLEWVKSLCEMVLVKDYVHWVDRREGR